jgi:Family of unknown function (DUF6308)
VAYKNEQRVDKIISHSATQDLIATFFERDSRFEGNLLEKIGENHPTKIGIDDLLAITMLDVSVRPRGIRRLIFDTSVSAEITCLLEVIPPDVDIWTGGDHLASRGKAWELSALLQRKGDGIAAVTAGKLLSRKRPRLIPILDRVVGKIIAVKTHEQWDFFVSYLSDPERRSRLDAMNPANLDPGVSTLRILDVSLWMWGSEGRYAKAARASAGLKDPEREKVLSS